MSQVHLCWCYDCNLNFTDPLSGLPLVMVKMIVCPTCGNKRCPRATNHRHDCTGSNEAGQLGSHYGVQHTGEPRG